MTDAINIPRAELQAALDALELLAKYENPETRIQVRKPASGGPIVTVYPHKVATDAAALLRERLAQPEPEPVAWMYDWYAEDEDLDGVPTGGIVNDWISKDCDEAHSPTMGCHNIRPLYAAPPQRPWQGLTDEEIQKTYFSCRADSLDYARAIEAKLKEKNN